MGNRQAFRRDRDQTLDSRLSAIIRREQFGDVLEHQDQQMHDGFDVLAVREHLQNLLVGQKLEPVLNRPFDRNEFLERFVD